jgi:uncharacterized protein (UPF0276 family)
MPDGGTREMIAARAGIGLRAPHFEQLLEARPPAGFLEIHAENYLAPGAPLSRLEALRADYPLSVHGVGLSLGSADGIDDAHLGRVAALVDRLQPALVSEHLAWSVNGGVYLNDLLPLPYTEEALAAVCRNVTRMQDALARPILLENPSAYLAFAHSTIAEPAFLAEIVRRTGCGLLFDANNIHVSAHNLGLDPQDWLDGLPADAIGEYHLAGHATNDADGATVLIDDHGSRVAPPVWQLFERTLACFGARPTLVEWDTDIPALAVLLGEAARADAVLARHQGEEGHGHPRPA